MIFGCKKEIRKLSNYTKRILTVNSASSKSNKGPVVPTISNGCPENREKMTPDTDVATKVSDIPMKFLVLSAENYVKTMVCLKMKANFLLNGWESMRVY